jgi:hydroxyacylglutathione hydrolase
VGDAARYYDPITGQGIYRALKGAARSAAAADAALRAGDLSAGAHAGAPRPPVAGGDAMLRVVRAENPSAMTLDGTRTFVVGAGAPVVIDPGPDDPAHLRAVLRALAGGRPAAILLTHAHADHAAGAPALATATGAPVMMGAGALHPPFPADLVGRWLRDGERVGEVELVATPGHAPVHLSFLWTGPGSPPGGALFVGDLFMGEGDTTLVAPPEGDLGAYLASLRRVGALAPAVLHPAHGPPLEDAAGAVERFLCHRTERIRQVRRALERRPDASPEALLEEVYGPALDPALRAAAAGSVRAILDHLRAGI